MSIKKLIRILHLEDNPNDAELVRSKLDAAGISSDVTRVGTRNEFLTAVGHDGFDLIISDFSLPSFDGLSALKIAREKCADVPFLFVSATMGEDAAIESLLNGATDYVLKQKMSRLVPAVVRALRETEERKERRQAEEALKESERRYRMLFDSNPLPMWVFDLETLRFLAVNDATVNHYGYSREKFLSMTIKDFRPVERIPEMLEDVARARTGIDAKGTWQHRKKDQTIIDVEIMAHGIVFGGRQARLVLANDVTERKRSVEALHQAEQKYRSIFENAMEGIYQTSPDGRYLSANPALARMYGYNSPEDLMATVTDLNRQYYVDPNRRNDFRKILEGRDSISNFESVIYRKDGSTMWVSENARSVRDANGTLLYYEGTTEDITSRKRAEEALRKNEEQLSLVYGNVSDIIFYLAVEPHDQFRFVSVNPAFLKAFGLAPEQVVEKLVHEVIPEPSLSLVLGKYQEAIREKRSVSWEETSEYPAGRKHGEVSVTPIFDADGRCTSLIGAVHDITERKQAEAALLESGTKYRQFFEEDLTADFISKPDGTLVDCNPAFARIFGFASVEEAKNTNALALFPDLKRRDEFLDRLKKEKRLEYHETELLRRDGNRIYVVENVVGKFDELGELVEIKGYLFDDTKRRTVEQQLVQSQRIESLGTLASGIAHDFNNILAIILAHSSVMEGSSLIAEQLSKNVEAIKKATFRGASLVKQLLTFARKTDVLLESVRVTDIINEVAKVIQETFPKTVTVSTSIQSNMPSVIADATQIHQVLLNLCVNARDAMPKGGTLSISAATVSGELLSTRYPQAKAREYLEVQVRDTGSGMEEATRKRIFEPFFTTKDVGKGTGLGLSLVFSIVENHKGFVGVESQVGKGSTFRVYLPAQKRPRERPELKQLAEPVPGGTETILLIEDEAMLTESVKVVLVTNGYTVLTAEDGAEGVEMFARHHKEISIVITDMGLPKLSGEEVFKKIRAMEPSANVILASGFIDPNLKSEMYKAGAKQFIQKPYLPEEILREIRNVLDA